MRVAFYARVSSDRQKEEQTIESQLEALHEFAGQQGWPVGNEHIYVDDGYSGFYLDRPSLDRARDAARDGLIDILLVHDPDRLSRRYAYQVLLLEELERWSVPVRFLRQPPPDTPEQMLLVQIQGAVSEYERARIMERTRRGRLFWARQGRPVCARVPYGYRYVSGAPDKAASVEVDEERARVVQQIFRWCADDGLSVRKIALRLTGEAIETPLGKSPNWHPGSVRFILSNEAYLGDWFLNQYRTEMTAAGHRKRQVKRAREEWIPVPITPLIDSVIFAKAQRVRKLNSATRGPRPLSYPESHLLRRLVVCGSCGKKTTCLNSKTRQGGFYPYYWCRGPDPHRIDPSGSPRCPHPTMKAAGLDDLVWRDVTALLTDPALLLESWREQQGHDDTRSDVVINEEHRRIKKQLTDARSQRQRLLVAYEQSAIDLQELVSRREILDQRAVEFSRRIKNFESEQEKKLTFSDLEKRIKKVCGTLATKLSTFNMEGRMGLCRELIERVVVEQGTAQIHYRFPVST